MVCDNEIWTNHFYLYLAAGNLICGIYTIIFIKLWSYAQVNYWCRTSLGSKIGGATFDGRQIANRNNSMIELNPNAPTSKQELDWSYSKLSIYIHVICLKLIECPTQSIFYRKDAIEVREEGFCWECSCSVSR